ncbi:hypothetical protein Ocin01_04505 [Orchesella cincta]|uniref:Uncharacterized protein n=1 Tax=Orchesella cincta TaxID=48709 RepID=A0A1D2NA97_ORCCI|nr:hypothetical protein Ocin01_04505 [Orchesella cincta]
MIRQVRSSRLAIIVTIFVLLYLTDCANSYSGQRVLWLYVLPQSQLYHHDRIPKVVEPAPEYITSELDSVQSYSRIRRFNEFHDHSQSQPLYHSRVITPLFITEYGSDSWQARGNAEPVYYENMMTTMGNRKEDDDSSGGSTEVGVENLR